MYYNSLGVKYRQADVAFCICLELNYPNMWKTQVQNIVVTEYRICRHITAGYAEQLTPPALQYM